MQTIFPQVIANVQTARSSLLVILNYTRLIHITQKNTSKQQKRKGPNAVIRCDSNLDKEDENRESKRNILI